MNKKIKKIILFIILIIMILFLMFFIKENYSKLSLVKSSVFNKFSLSKNEVFYGYSSNFFDNENLDGIDIHILNLSDDEMKKSIDMLKKLGVNTIRIDLKSEYILKNNKLDFSKYDSKMKLIKESNLIPIVIVDTNFVQDKKIKDDKELNQYCRYIEEINRKYDFIKFYEICNEPNVIYKTDEDIKWYVELVKKSKEILKDKYLIAGSTIQDGDENFIKKINSLGVYEYTNAYSFHYYSLKPNFDEYNNEMKKMTNLKNDIGGFQEFFITETGIPSIERINFDDGQAKCIIKFLTIIDSFKIKTKILYNFQDTGNQQNVYASDYYEKNYGIIKNDFSLKKSYYGLNNFYQNFRGAIEVGKIYSSDGLETYVYDKDGEAKIIIWSTDENTPIKINYNGFIAKDLYGNDIENKDGKLTITSSPIYLDNISNSYFYKGISNSIISGYDEFNTKFADEIVKVPGLLNRISTLNNDASNLSKINSLDENKANELMKNHFELGNLIIEAYKSGKLNIEYVKLSSMLDYLNTIGDSYEDLVTVSAKTRLADLKDIINEVNEAKRLAEDNEKIDIVYPDKIYKFSQDFLDESNYILGLKEENNIKSGLINSKALHALYLAQWSQEFSEIYIRDSYKDSVNDIINTNLSLKNKYSNIYSNQEIANRYNDLINSLNDIIENSVNNNYDIINDVFSKQFELNKIIIKKYNSKDISIDDRSYKDLIQNLVDLSDKYKTLFNIYVKNDSVENNVVEDTLNNIINRYNANTDIDLTQSTDLINQAINIYDNSITTESISDNDLNKQRIIKTCDMISSILENDIKKRADEESKFIKITYSEDINNFTNKDIVATINLPNDKAKVTNNNGQKCYTFTKNGNITYNVNIRGYDYTYNISINNIDKKTPDVRGLENSKLFSNTVTPKIIEENLSQVKLQYEGKTDIKYNLGDSISEPGIYTLTVTDKAGNTSSNNFIISGTYNKLIEYIPVYNDNTKVNELTQNTNYKIIRNGQELSSDSLVATGDRFEYGNKGFSLILRGDIDGDGTSSIKDLLKIRKKIIDLVEFDKLQEMSADINHDGNVDIKDLVKMRKMIIQLE